MNAAAKVVTNRTGRRIKRAKPTTTTMKMRAPRRPTRSAPIREKTTTVMVMIMNRPRGKPVRVIWEKMNDYLYIERGVS